MTHTPTPPQPEDHIAPAHKMVQPDTTDELERISRALEHDVPESCYSTGPLTGTAMDNSCLACDGLKALAALKARDTRIRAGARIGALNELEIDGVTGTIYDVETDNYIDVGVYINKMIESAEADLKEKTKDE